MTTATRTAETQNGIIEIKLTREVNDEVAFADGYNIPAGRKVYESYDVKLTHKASGKVIRHYGKPGGFAFFETDSRFSKMPAGAYARIGDAYVGKEVYDLAMSMIAELDAEVGKTDEQIALEQPVTVRKQAREAAEAAEAAEYARQIKNGLCPKCHTYCYGDCEAN